MCQLLTNFQIPWSKKAYLDSKNSKFGHVNLKKTINLIRNFLIVR